MKIPPPDRSYVIWFTPRTGSTLLTKTLSQLGVAGTPGEHLNIAQDQTLDGHYQVDSFEGLCEAMWQTGAGDNSGIMAMKYSYATGWHDRLTADLARLRGRGPLDSMDWHSWETLFPRTKHVFLTRRHKLNIAASWWKAIQDSQWHRVPGEAAKGEDFYADKYNVNALTHLLKDHLIRETATQAFFDRNGIAPYTLVYEDMVADFEGTLTRLLAYLEIEAPQIPSMPFQPTFNAVNAAWVERLRKDLQEGWNPVIW